MARRFPDFGFYYQVTPRYADEPEEPTFADAVDDVYDIAGDLRDAQWYRVHGQPGDGERHAALHFVIHWGRHLRDLQSHLHLLIHGQ